MTTPTDTPIVMDTGTAVQIIKRSRSEDDEKKSSYLSFRACYISEAEAKRYARVTQQTLDQWRIEDPLFAQAELIDLVGFQEIASKVALLIEYTRTYRLALARDLEVWRKSLEDPDALTPHEHQYLNKVRSTLTPEGLDRLTRIAQGQVSEDDDIMTYIRDRTRVVEIHKERSILHVPKPHDNGDHVVDHEPLCDNSPGGAGDASDSGKG